MSYTFHPLVDIYHDSHVGFFFVTPALIVVAYLIIQAYRGGDIPGKVCSFIIACLAVTGVVAYDGSYNTPEKIYANTKVIGTFVGFTGEAIVNKSGRAGVRVDHVTYVTYKVDAGYVTLPASPGVSYPARVILYRN